MVVCIVFCILVFVMLGLFVIGIFSLIGVFVMCVYIYDNGCLMMVMVDGDWVIFMIVEGVEYMFESNFFIFVVYFDWDVYFLGGEFVVVCYLFLYL